VYTGLWRGNLKERGFFEDLSVGGRIILEGILNNIRRDLKSVGKIERTQTTDRRLAVVNAVMNSPIP
jgi:hypothetical protein